MKYLVELHDSLSEALDKLVAPYVGKKFMDSFLNSLRGPHLQFMGGHWRMSSKVSHILPLFLCASSSPLATQVDQGPCAQSVGIGLYLRDALLDGIHVSPVCHLRHHLTAFFSPTSTSVMDTFYPGVVERFKNIAKNIEDRYGITPMFGYFYCVCFNIPVPSLNRRVLLRPHLTSRTPLPSAWCMFSV